MRVLSISKSMEYTVEVLYRSSKIGGGGGCPDIEIEAFDPESELFRKREACCDWGLQLTIKQRDEAIHVPIESLRGFEAELGKAIGAVRKREEQIKKLGRDTVIQVK